MLKGAGVESIQVRPVLRALQLQDLLHARHAPELGPQLLSQTTDRGHASSSLDLQGARARDPAKHGVVSRLTAAADGC